MYRILIIDDDLAVLRMLYETFTLAGYDVDVATDGDAGLRAYARHKSDVIVTDIVMPHQEGLETIRELRRLCPEAKVIAISGGARTYLDCARQFGAVRILEKPFAPADILKAVSEVLGRD
jgi:CheY-like chemotaxis protein